MPNSAPDSFGSPPRDPSGPAIGAESGPLAGSIPDGSGPDPDPAVQSQPSIGAQVLLSRPLAYLKTAEPRPMLRPPDLIDRAEVGQVVAHHALGQCAVRFRRGTFLIEARDLRLPNGITAPTDG
jgi:hypothetical protein